MSSCKQQQEVVYKKEPKNSSEHHLLIYKYQAYHWSAKTPLIAKILEQNYLKEGLEYLNKS